MRATIPLFKSAVLNSWRHTRYSSTLLLHIQACAGVPDALAALLANMVVAQKLAICDSQSSEQSHWTIIVIKMDHQCLVKGRHYLASSGPRSEAKGPVSFPIDAFIITLISRLFLRCTPAAAASSEQFLAQSEASFKLCGLLLCLDAPCPFATGLPLLLA